MNIAAKLVRPRPPTVSSARPSRRTFRTGPPGLAIAWRGVLRDGSNYVRQEFLLPGTKPATISELSSQQVAVPSPKLAGTLPESPVTSRKLFFGTELPVPQNTLPRIPCRLGLKTPVNDKSDVAPAGQMRAA